MRSVTLKHETDFDGWRDGARRLRLAGVRPHEAVFHVSAGYRGLFDEALPDPDPHPVSTAGASGFAVPRAFVDVAKEIVLHRSPDRFALLYRLLWRLEKEPDLMKALSDVDVADALERAKNVSRASHKMKAFVRFRAVKDADGESWVAWFEPAHRVVEKTAPFFARRFTTMRWSILTPDGSVFWDKQTLTSGPPATRDMAPGEDDVEEFWKTYYASTFNPARLKTKTMQGEMPKRYWKNLPEASLIRELVAQSMVRTDTMVAAPLPEPNARFARATARHGPRVISGDLIPSTPTELDQAVQACRRCPLWRDATQGVCGEGPKPARLMIVGEQPGDHEDLEGRPFIGPAGEVLNEALKEAGIDRADVFVTNAVKHFKHEPRGKRRLHKTPNTGEIAACRWWLNRERALVKPAAIVMMGVTAALGVLGRKVSVTEIRGEALSLPDARGLVTVHPSYLLRMPDRDRAAMERDRFVADLKTARSLL